MFDENPGAPQPLGDETEHYWLVQRMAQANGTDLVAAADAGIIDQRAWSALVHRCRSCQWVDGCKRWLDAPETDTRETPEDCRNRQRFEDIQEKLAGI